MTGGCLDAVRLLLSLWPLLIPSFFPEAAKKAATVPSSARPPLPTWASHTARPPLFLQDVQSTAAVLPSVLPTRVQGKELKLQRPFKKK